MIAIEETEQGGLTVADPGQPMDMDTVAEPSTDSAGDGMADEEEG